jgi:hypothetical protein
MAMTMPDIFIGGGNEPVELAPKKEAEKKQEKPQEKPRVVLEKHNHPHIFASYCEKPVSVNFQQQLENEEILLFLRKHFITNVPWIIRAVIMALVPILIGIINSLGIVDINFFPPNYILMFLIFYYFLIFGYFFTNYLTWFYNISLVTTLRIIDIDFSSIVFENVAATKLSQVEDVSYSQIGVIRSIFDYGNVLVQTAAHVDEFEFPAVPHPEKVITVINSVIGGSPNA